MSNWKIKQVGEWLKSSGFELFVRTFKENGIDGATLATLNDDIIDQLLSINDKGKKLNMANIKNFKEKLQEWKMNHSGDSNRQRNERLSSATSMSSTMMTTSINEPSISDKSTDATYTKILTITHDSSRDNVKFFYNSRFCKSVQVYLSKKYDIKCSIGLKQQDASLTLVGIKHQVKSGYRDLKILFESTQTKIYNSGTTDQKPIYWSKHIFSDATISVIQQIMDNEKIFTVWDKPKMFSGYYQVTYFSHESFTVSEESITQILNREITYIENIKMPNEKTKKFMKEIEEFLIRRKEPELAIIHCKYPLQMEIKISLFGRKKLVKTVKKEIELLVNKHTLKLFNIKMTPIQNNYLTDNCLQRFKDIENDYKDDNVQIRIRQKEFYAPQYLIEKVKQQINELICQTVIYSIQIIGNSISLTDRNTAQLNQIAKRYNCRIERIESKAEMQVHPIPKALAKTSSTPSLMIKESTAFCSSLSVKKISVSNGSIEIYSADHSIPLSDLTVVSTDAGAVQERIGPVVENGFFEISTDRKILFCRWPNFKGEVDKMSTKLQRWIRKFVSMIVQNITVCCPDAETIAFSTCEWENFNAGPQFAEELIVQIKHELEMRNSRWRILFIFSHEQANLYKEFLQAMVQFQFDEDGFVQFQCPVLKINITLTTSKGNNLIACENEMTCYIRKNISTTETLKYASDLRNWDQHMINIFYKYCLEKSISPNIDLTIYQLQLIGSEKGVEKAMQKYKLMSEILQLKSSIRIPPPVAPRSSITGRSQSDTSNYNIAFSYCSQDEAVCQHLATLLVDEGYSICQSLPHKFLSQTQIDRSDLMLIYFSENYSQDARCMADIKYAKSIRKQIIPTAAMKNLLQDTEENSWLYAVQNAQLFYNIFETEIEIEFNGDFDLEYDKLLAILLRHIKPGVTGQFYPQTPIAPETKSMETNYEEAAFGYKSVNLQKVTTVQRKEREKAYKLQVKKRIENENISSDEIDILVESLILVVEDLEAILRGENPDKYIDPDHYEKYDIRRRWTGEFEEYSYSRVFADEFLDCIKRWLRRTPNVIKKNIAPFTPTGDINDAVFSIYRSTDFDWWKPNYEPFETLPSEDYFSAPGFNQGSWFTIDQAHDCLQLMIKMNGRVNIIDKKLHENETAGNMISISDGDYKTSTNNEDGIGDHWKTPKEIQKIQELDNPNRKWKRKRRVTEAFMKQKLRNIIEFQQLCAKTS